MSHQPNSKSRQLGLAGMIAGMVLLVTLVVVIATTSRSDEPETPTPVNTPTPVTSPIESAPAQPEVNTSQPPDATDNPPPSVDQPTASDQPDPDNDNNEPVVATEPIRTQTPGLPINPISPQLPPDWEQLSLTQKTLLNPFDCPADDGGIIHLNAETGQCLTGQQTTPPLESRELEDPNSFELGQPFETSLGKLELQLTGQSFTCQRISDLVQTELPGRTPSEIQTAFDTYTNNFESLDLDQRWRVLGFAAALDYMASFSRQLSQDNPSATVTSRQAWQSLLDHKECRLSLKLKNIGDNYSFSDGCGPDLDPYLTVVGSSQQQVYPAGSLGSRRACSQAEVPFPTGDSFTQMVVFTMPADGLAKAIAVESGQSDLQTLIVGLDSSI